MRDLHILHILDHSQPVVSGYSMRSHAVLCAQCTIGLMPVALTSAKQAAGDGDVVIDGIQYLRSARVAGNRTPLLGQSQLMVQRAGRLRREVAGRHVGLLHAHSPLLNGFPAL